MISPPDTPEQIWRTSDVSAPATDTASGSSRTMSHLPLKKRGLARCSGGGDVDSDDSKSNSPNCGDASMDVTANSPPDTPPSVYSSYSSYPSSISHMASALEDSSMSSSQDVPSSPAPSTSTTYDVQHFEPFSPENIFSPENSSSQASTSSLASGSKPKKKKKSFVYFINRKPIENFGKKIPDRNQMERHSPSMSNTGPTTCHNLAETLDLPSMPTGVSASLPPPVSPNFYPPASSFGRHYDSQTFHENRLPPSAFLQYPHRQQFPMAGHFSGGMGVFPGMLPPLDRDDASTPSTSGGVRKKKPQQCRLCANHDIYERVKGHKYHCKFRDCDCAGCVVTRNKQVAVRDHAKMTRAQENMKQEQQLYSNSPQPYGVVDPRKHLATAEMVRDLELQDPNYNPQDYDEDDED